MLAQVIFKEHTPIQEAYFSFINVCCYIILLAMFFYFVRIIFSVVPFFNFMATNFLNTAYKKKKK